MWLLAPKVNSPQVCTEAYVQMMTRLCRMSSFCQRLILVAIISRRSDLLYMMDATKYLRFHLWCVISAESWIFLHHLHVTSSSVSKSLNFQIISRSTWIYINHRFSLWFHISRPHCLFKLTVAMAAEGSDGEMCFWASSVSVPNHHPPHRQMVSEVQVAFICVPGKPQRGCWNYNISVTHTS